jgi:hypothetical protein
VLSIIYGLLLFERFGWIANNSHARGHILSNYGTHAYNSSFADNQWFLRSSLFEDSASTNIDMIMNMNITIATNLRCKGHKITNNAIMTNVTVSICMKTKTDFNI